MVRQTVKKGRHFCWPRIIDVQKDRTLLDINFCVGHGFKYHISGEDQYDWLKLDGLYWMKRCWHLWKTRWVTAMLAGRYVDGEVHLNFYYHCFEKAPTYDNDFVRVPIGFEGRFVIRARWDRKLVLELYDSKGVMLMREVRYMPSKLPKWSNRINFYFGGNRRAPNDVSIEKW